MRSQRDVAFLTGVTLRHVLRNPPRPRPTLTNSCCSYLGKTLNQQRGGPTKIETKKGTLKPQSARFDCCGHAAMRLPVRGCVGDHCYWPQLVLGCALCRRLRRLLRAAAASERRVRRRGPSDSEPHHCVSTPDDACGTTCTYCAHLPPWDLHISFERTGEASEI